MYLCQYVIQILTYMYINTKRKETLLNRKYFNEAINQPE